MIPSIDFIQPKNIEELLSLLNNFPDESCIIAGGTDIIPGMQQGASRFKKFKRLIDIHHLPELKLIKVEDGVLIIGAGVTFSDIIKSSLTQNHFPLLTKAASSVGSVQIRNRATIAGNFINNAPCADSVPPLLVYDAMVRIHSFNNQYDIALKDLLLKPYQTKMEPNEIVTQISLPILSETYRGEFYKLGRRQGVAISRISIAVLIDIHQSRIMDIRIASGAITPIGKRFPELEKFARQKKLEIKLLKELARKLGKEILITTGLRWSTPYKLPVVQQIFFQLLSNITK